MGTIARSVYPTAPQSSPIRRGPLSLDAAEHFGRTLEATVRDGCERVKDDVKGVTGQHRDLINNALRTDRPVPTWQLGRAIALLAHSAPKAVERRVVRPAGVLLRSMLHIDQQACTIRLWTEGETQQRSTDAAEQAFVLDKSDANLARLIDCKTAEFYAVNRSLNALLKERNDRERGRVVQVPRLTVQRGGVR